MQYNCFNCEEIIELDIYIESIDSLTCPECSTYLYLEVYKQCSNCSYFYLNNYLVCPYCMKDENITIPELNYLYVKTLQDYQKAVEYIESADILGLDTEGNGLDPFTLEMFLIQIGDEEKVFIFDFDWHKRLSEEIFWKEKLFIIHNAKFDCKALKHILNIDIKYFFDTYLAERVLTCGFERRNSLKEVVEKYLDIKMDKEIRDDFLKLHKDNFKNNVSKELLEYSARDVQYLPIIYRQQKWELENQNLSKIAQLEFNVCKVIVDMELTGIYVEVEAWKKIIESCDTKKGEIESSIHSLLLDQGFQDGLFSEFKFNLNSTKDLKMIFGKFGIHLNSTGDADLAQIDHPLASLMREYRKYEKQLSSFGQSFLDLVRKETSRVHPSFNQIGADTGRFSCNNPNLQQIPADEVYRKCFTAPSGRKIIACDYSQQELRLLASLSGDPKFIKFYEDGVDLHTATASMMFNIPLEKVEKETHRKIAKTINFGLAYGQGARKLGLTIGVSQDEAEKMIDKYFSQFTFIGDWLNQAALDAQQKGYSTTLMGRKRFYKIPDQSSLDYKQQMAAIGRQGKNSPIQGSGVDMVKLAMCFIHKRLKESRLDAYLINAVHDELIVESSEKDAEAASLIVKDCMVEAGQLMAPNVPILAEEGIGDYWKH